MRITVNGSFTQEGIKIFLKLMPFSSSPYPFSLLIFILWLNLLYSGGKDLSGNKRTNKQHSKDQEFTKLNQALRLSCVQGYPVRVVR